jgi:uncharacterized membrane protein (TIGR02234 family)
VSVPEPRRPRDRSRRTALVAVVAGAALALIAGLPNWLVQHFGSDSSGELHRSGNEAAPGLLPLALVALAGLIATFAVRGWASRLVGGVLVAAGGGIVASALSVALSPPADATSGDAGLPAAPDLMGPVQVQWWPVLLGVLGGVVVVLGGLVLVLAPARSALGSRFEAPGRGVRNPTVDGQPDDRRSRPVSDAESAVDWWKSLDAGTDPTDTDSAAGDVRPAPIGDRVNPAVRRQLP